MLGRRLIQLLVLTATYVAFDLYFKDWFLALVSGGAETPDLAHVFLAYMTPFVLAFVLSELLIKTLRVDQAERNEEYE